MWQTRVKIIMRIKVNWFDLGYLFIQRVFEQDLSLVQGIIVFNTLDSEIVTERLTLMYNVSFQCFSVPQQITLPVTVP